MKNYFDVIVVGAGLSGLFCAFEVAKGGGDVLLIEKQSLPARKFLYSGMGKAPVSNAEVDTSRFHGRDARFVSDALNAFDYTAWASALGLEIANQKHYGLIACQEPEQLIAKLTEDYLDLGGEISVDTEVLSINPGFELHLAGDQTASCDKLVLACGGPNLPQLGGTLLGTDSASKLGHQIRPPVPGQVGLIPDESWPLKASGLWMDVELKVLDGLKSMARTYGSMLFTRSGITGQAVFNVSKVVSRMLRSEKQPELEINLFPNLSKDEVGQWLFRTFGERTKERAIEALDVILPAKIGGAFLGQLGLKPTARVMQMGKPQRDKLLEQMVSARTKIVGTMGLWAAETFSGGVSVREVSPRTFQSKLNPNLYLVGSLLDIDADWGGLAQHFAIGSGILAGQSLAKSAKVQ